MYTVKDILETKGYKCWTVSSDNTVYEALKKMAGHNVGAVIVVEDDKVLGIFSERDYARKVVLMGKTSRDTKVGEFMTDRFINVKKSTTVNECMQLMHDNRERHLPVLDDDQKLIGVISIGDIVYKTIQDKDNQIHQLEDYITGKG